jgi:8-oxo-dGTP pyrophosphatase MutT (NUDIX family)
MTQIYTDRFGKLHKTKNGITIRDRSGAWFVLVQDDQILFTHPHYAPTVPDLPGGGIDEGENALEAAIRELNEETELVIKNPKIAETYNQFVHFFADDVPEYWNYEQTFFLVREGINELHFHGKIKMFQKALVNG